MQGCLQSESQGAYRLTSALINGGLFRGGGHYQRLRERNTSPRPDTIFVMVKGQLCQLCARFCALREPFCCTGHIWGFIYGAARVVAVILATLIAVLDEFGVVFKPLFILICDVHSCKQATAHLPESPLRSITFIFSPRQSLTAPSEIIHCACLGNTIILTT